MLHQCKKIFNKIQRNNKKSGNWITAEDEQLKHYATSAILDLTFY